VITCIRPDTGWFVLITHDDGAAGELNDNGDWVETGVATLVPPSKWTKWSTSNTCACTVVDDGYVEMVQGFHTRWVQRGCVSCRGSNDNTKLTRDGSHCVKTVGRNTWSCERAGLKSQGKRSAERHNNKGPSGRCKWPRVVVEQRKFGRATDTKTIRNCRHRRPRDSNRGHKDAHDESVSTRTRVICQDGWLPTKKHYVGWLASQKHNDHERGTDIRSDERNHKSQNAKNGGKTSTGHRIADSFRRR